MLLGHNPWPLGAWLYAQPTEGVSNDHQGQGPSAPIHPAGSLPPQVKGECLLHSPRQEADIFSL